MAAIRFGWPDARAGIGRFSPRLQLQNGRFSEVPKHNRRLLPRTGLNSFGVRFGVRSERCSLD